MHDLMPPGLDEVAANYCDSGRFRKAESAGIRNAGEEEVQPAPISNEKLLAAVKPSYHSRFRHNITDVTCHV